MKKKIIIASATVLFAVATIFNMNLLQSNYVGDISLESIEVMAKAQAESMPNDCKAVWESVYCYSSNGQKVSYAIKK